LSCSTAEAAADFGRIEVARLAEGEVGVPPHADAVVVAPGQQRGSGVGEHMAVVWNRL
jgi:hypothetical protein